MDREWTTLRCPWCPWLYASRGERPPICPTCKKTVGKTQWRIITSPPKLLTPINDLDRDWLRVLGVVVPDK